jgi:protease I
MSDGLPPRTRVAVLIEDDFEDRELPLLVDTLRTTGLLVTLIGPTAGTDFHGKRRDAVIRSDVAASKVRMQDFDCVVVPGGYAPDRIRLRHAMVDLVRDALDSGKPVGAIDRGPQVLITVNALRGRTVTCWPSIAIDVKNAGGRYVDRPVVEDGLLITARKWDDVPAFCNVVARALGVPV